MIYKLLGALILLVLAYLGGRWDGQRVERASCLKQREVARLAAEAVTAKANERYQELKGTALQSVSLLGEILSKPATIQKETLVKEVPIEVAGKCFDRSTEYRVSYNSLGATALEDSTRTVPRPPDRDSSL